MSLSSTLLPAPSSATTPDTSCPRIMGSRRRAVAEQPAGQALVTGSVLGTPAFMEFVESIQSEGVQLEYRPMGGNTHAKDSMVIEVETGNDAKDLDALDISLPRLSRRYSRDFKSLEELAPDALGNPRLALKPFTEEQTREIVFKTLLEGEVDHSILLDSAGPADYRSVVAFFARQLLKDMRLVGGYDQLYPKVRDFLRDQLFESSPVDLEDAVVLRNLSEPEPGKILFDAFKAAINRLTVREHGSARIEDRIRLRDTRPFRTENRPYLPVKKSVFNRIVGEAHAGGFELAFAKFLDDAPDVASFAKNYLAVGFKLDYVKADKDLSHYIPDFIVKTADGTVFIIETKGRAELDLPQKMTRLKQWCEDATTGSRAEGGPSYRFVYVDQEGYQRNPPSTLAGLTAAFRDFQA